jgi:hypothetical protein
LFALYWGLSEVKEIKKKEETKSVCDLDATIEFQKDALRKMKK